MPTISAKLCTRDAATNSTEPLIWKSVAPQIGEDDQRWLDKRSGSEAASIRGGCNEAGRASLRGEGRWAASDYEIRRAARLSGDLARFAFFDNLPEIRGYDAIVMRQDFIEDPLRAVRRLPGLRLALGGLGLVYLHLGLKITHSGTLPHATTTNSGRDRGMRPRSKRWQAQGNFAARGAGRPRLGGRERWNRQIVQTGRLRQAGAARE
jgi:hypothetical protein